MIGVQDLAKEYHVGDHIVHALRSAVSRLVAIDVGRVLVEGPPDDVMANADVQRVYLGIDVE